MFEEIRQSATVPLVARYSEVVEAAMRRGSEPVGRVTELLDACGNAFVTLATLCIARGGHVVYVDTAVSKGFPGISENHFLNEAVVLGLRHSLPVPDILDRVHIVGQGHWCS